MTKKINVYFSLDSPFWSDGGLLKFRFSRFFFILLITNWWLFRICSL